MTDLAQRGTIADASRPDGRTSTPRWIGSVTCACSSSREDAGEALESLHRDRLRGHVKH